MIPLAILIHLEKLDNLVNDRIAFYADVNERIIIRIPSLIML
ncbi:MAG: hypothetical protein AB8U25_02630 [Rickettsiales endosymbiont of Dermacentor nuttalli]